MGGRGWQVSEFKASLIYRKSSKTARETQRNPDLNKQKPKQKDMKTKEPNKNQEANMKKQQLKNEKNLNMP